MRLSVAIILTIIALIIFDVAVFTAHLFVPQFAAQNVVVANYSALRATMPLAAVGLAFLIGWLLRPGTRSASAEAGGNPAARRAHDLEVSVLWGVLPWVIVFVAMLSHIFARTSGFSELVVLLTQIVIGAILGMLVAALVRT